MNPFAYTQPVRDPQMYAGRPEIKRRLAEWLQPGALVSITGPRRMGTTSTLHLMLETWATRNVRSVYIDLRGMAYPISANGLRSAILRELGLKADGVVGDIPISTSSLEPFALGVDEFDLAQGPHSRDVLTFLTMVLSGELDFCNEALGGPTGILRGLYLGSRNSLFDIERAEECVGSPWFHLFHNVRLQPLSPDDGFRLVCRQAEAAGAPLEHDAPWLIRYAGTWPFFLKLAAHHAFERHVGTTGGRLAKRDRAAVEECVYEEAAPYLDGYWRDLSSRQRDLLANLRTWRAPNDDMATEPDVIHLARDGILRRRGTHAKFSCELFRAFFAAAHRHEALAGHSRPSGDDAFRDVIDCLAQCGACVAAMTSVPTDTEQRLQEIVHVMLRSRFTNVAREAHVARGGKREYKADFYLEDFDIVIEIKRVRNKRHAGLIQAEINDDLVGYTDSHPSRYVAFLIWDDRQHVGDRRYFIDKYERIRSTARILFAP